MHDFNKTIRELLGGEWLVDFAAELCESFTGFSANGSVYQHLHWGGLKYREIASLVPDGNGRRGAEERVRARVKAPNARSLLPYDPAGRTNKSSKAEKSRKRVSSS